MADNNDIFELMTKMYSEMTTKMNDIQSEIKGMKSDIAKNSVLLEKVDSNVKLLAEGQEAFREQIGRSNEKDNRSVNDKLETIELAVINTSKTVNNLSETLEVVKDAVGSNEMDLKILKRLQSKNL